jgi:glycosyltransferase involved in cell wall biosynthesis
VYDTLRTAHLERAAERPDVSVLYRRRRYDFDDSLAAGLDLLPGNDLSAAVTVLRSRPRVVEVNEPLMRSAVVRGAVVVAAARLGAVLHGSGVRVVAYAIENRDPFPAGPLRPRARLRAARDRRLARWTARQLDRLAYGTPGAAALYERLLGPELAGVETALVPAVPAACGCLADDGPQDPEGVLFVGAFSPRKGLPELLAAWPHVVREHPRARLTLLGKGPLEDRARALADRDQAVRLLVDPPRAEVHRALRQAAVLVLLSQPTPGWREQVGLPLVEGLAHGCSVVTTSQTGLADWLADHGHAVLPPHAPATEVAARIAAALQARRPADDVLNDLPTTDGRASADHWLDAAADLA